jgi:hypothetical protein
VQGQGGVGLTPRARLAVNRKRLACGGPGDSGVVCVRSQLRKAAARAEVNGPAGVGKSEGSWPGRGIRPKGHRLRSSLLYLLIFQFLF